MLQRYLLSHRDLLIFVDFFHRSPQPTEAYYVFHVSFLFADCVDEFISFLSHSVTHGVYSFSLLKLLLGKKDYIIA